VNTKHLSIAIGVLALTATSVQAHGIWFAQRSGALAMIYGEGASDDAIVENMARVQHLAAYDASGTPGCHQTGERDALRPSGLGSCGSAHSRQESSGPHRQARQLERGRRL